YGVRSNKCREQGEKILDTRLKHLLLVHLTRDNTYLGYSLLVKIHILTRQLSS
ncbi:hypothetical protein ACJX0J_036670, partial [Zea mays]